MKTRERSTWQLALVWAPVYASCGGRDGQATHWASDVGEHAAKYSDARHDAGASPLQGRHVAIPGLGGAVL